MPPAPQDINSFRFNQIRPKGIHLESAMNKLDLLRIDRIVCKDMFTYRFRDGDDLLALGHYRRVLVDGIKTVKAGDQGRTPVDRQQVPGQISDPARQSRAKMNDVNVFPQQVVIQLRDILQASRTLLADARPVQMFAAGLLQQGNQPAAAGNDDGAVAIDRQDTSPVQGSQPRHRLLPVQERSV